MTKERIKELERLKTEIKETYILKIEEIKDKNFEPQGYLSIKEHIQ